MNCTTLYDFKNVINPLKPVNIETFIQPQNLKSNLYSKSETVIDEMHRLENLIEKFSNTVIEKTPHETYLFNEIKNILKYEKSKVKNSEHNYFMGLIFFVSTLKQIKLSKIDENNLRLIKFRAQKTLDYLTSGIENKSLKTITQLVGSLQGSVVSRANIDICEIYELTHEIINLIEFQIDDVKWLSELKNKLSHYKFQKDEKELTLDQKKVTSEDQQIPKLEIILGNLRNILRKNNLDVYSKDSLISYKNNKNVQVIIEMLMLDVMCILSDSKNSAPNLLSLDKDCPLLIGKNLRNHLAHENALFDILQFDCSLAIIINAMKITSENIIDYKPTEGNDLNFKDNFGCTALHLSSKNEHLDVIKLLIRNGAVINIWNNIHDSPLFLAIENGNFEIIEFLIAEGADINLTNFFGFKALHFSILHRKKEVVAYLIQKGANINDPCYRQTPLQLAVQNNDFEMAQVLINNGAEIDAESDSGLTPLCLAVRNNNKEIVKILLKYGADINYGESLPLSTAIVFGLNNIAEILLDNEKIDIHYCGIDGNSLLHIAAKQGNHFIVESLLDRGADANAITLQNGISSLHCAADAGYVEIVKILLKNKAKINAVSNDGLTPLLLATSKGHASVVKLLLENGANAKKYTEALPLLEKVLERRKELYGDENPVTLDIQQYLGEVLYNLQHYQKALQTFEFVFLKQKELLGANHSDTLKTREIIGLILHELGEDEKTISIFREILPKQQEILGPNHSAVLQIQSDMALALIAVGQHEEALALNYKVLKAQSDLKVIMQKLSKLNHDEIAAIANAQNVQGNTFLQNASLNQPPGIVKNLQKFLLEKKIIFY
ncbi:UNVERIFIED_CONTAM: Ank3 [Trichonephila clavipes]